MSSHNFIRLIQLLRSLAHVLGQELVEAARQEGRIAPADPEAAGRRELYAVCQHALGRLRDRRFGRDLHVDTVLDRLKLRSKWRIQLPREDLPAKEFFRLLAECLTVLEMPLEFLMDLSPPCRPWCDWRPGDTLLVVKGSTHLEVRRDGVDFTRAFVGVPDATAEIRLASSVRAELKIDARVEHLHLLAGLDPTESTRQLAQLRGRVGLGAIVFIGSPRVNPMADAVARTFFNNGRAHSSLVHFEWAEPPLFGDNYLSSRRIVGTADEGIHYKHGDYNLRLPRVNDGIALREACAGQPGPWADAGLLLVDVRSRPWLILACGHGGCGTVAAVLSLLQRPYDLDRQLAASHQPGFYLGPNRALQLIRVRRTKPTNALHDDFNFDHETGWDIAGPWLPPATADTPA